jgi:hypothetical protein
LHRICIILLFLSSSLHAQVSMTGGFGFFSLSGKTRTTSTSVASPGLYSLGFSYHFHPQFDVHVSYNIQNESIIAGDRAFGPNLVIRYGYWGISPVMTIKSSDLRIQIKRSVLPYVKLGFAQRQFQSTRTSYSGPILGIGAVGNVWGPLPLFAELNMASLGGGQGATASELSFLVGIQVVF